jgi:hypothetical protein
MAVTRHGRTLLARVYGPAVPSKKILTGWGERSYINISSTAQCLSGRRLSWAFLLNHYEMRLRS